MTKLSCLLLSLLFLTGCHHTSVSEIEMKGEEIQEQKVQIEEDENTEVKYELEIVAENLYVPWSIAFTRPNRMLVTERDGKLRIIQNGQLQPEPLHTFQEVSTQAEEGLMGLALHPQYEQNKYIYLSLAYTAGDELWVKVVRFRDEGSELSDETIILDNIPAARYHAGCRIKFGPDGKLYITTGDALERDLAQDVNELHGKILRINPDGTIPADNPFPNSPVWSYGHRNAQGIDWHPETETLFSTEHGPSTFDGPPGGDEVNIIRKGGNYGWPLVSHDNTQEGTLAPLLVFTPAEAPGSGMFYSSDQFPQFTNNFFFGALRGAGIIRVVLDENDPEKVVSHEKLPDIDVGRIREVIEGPDGFIYFATSNRDGRGKVREGDDKIYRIVVRE